jgi:hypothetical protein
MALEDDGKWHDCKGALLLIGSHSGRGPVIDWCVGRTRRHRLLILGVSLRACGPAPPCARLDRSELNQTG